MADLKKLAEEIVGLTLLEAQELKTILKDEYGIAPAAGGAVMMAGPAGGDAGGVTMGAADLGTAQTSSPATSCRAARSSRFRVPRTRLPPNHRTRRVRCHEQVTP